MATAKPLYFSVVKPGGGAASGAVLTSYVRNTQTKTPLYLDVGLATPTNLVAADADGRFGATGLYFDNDNEYTWVVKTSNGATTLMQADVINGVLFVTSASSGFAIDSSWAAVISTPLAAGWATAFLAAFNAVTIAAAHLWAKATWGKLTAATKADLKALISPSTHVSYETSGYSSAGIGGGTFRWDAADWSVQCSADTAEGVFIPLSGNNGSAGAFIRQGVRAYNPYWFSAVGNGVADDTAAINACRTLAATGYGMQQSIISAGAIEWPVGKFKTTGIIMDVPGEHWIGLGGFLVAASASVTVLKITAASTIVREVGFLQTFRPTTAIGTVEITSPSDSTFSKNTIIGGYHGIKCYGGGSDNLLDDNKVNGCYSSFIYFTEGAAWVRRCKLDGDWPVSTPTSTSYKGAWTSATAYVAGDLVVKSGWTFQCRVGGTSAGSGGPAVADFGTDITDNTVTWRTACTQDRAAVHIDSTCFALLFENTDMTGGHFHGARITNLVGGGTAPQNIQFKGCEASAPLFTGIKADAGAAITWESGWVQGGLDVTAVGFDLGAVEHTIINAPFIRNFTNGVQIGASAKHTVITSGQFAACTTAVRAKAGATDFSVVANKMGGSSTWGACTNGVVVEAGASDRYIIFPNDFGGVTTPITDGGTGHDKTVGQRINIPAGIAGLLQGLMMANNGSDATNDIDITSGYAADSTGVFVMNGPAYTKQLDANFAAGTNAGMRNSAVAIANTTYAIYLATTTAGAGADYYAHTSSDPAIALAALQAETGGSTYAYLRRVGYILRESGAIVAFSQNGDEFLRTAHQDINASNPGTSAVLASLRVPAGIKVRAKITTMLVDATPAADTACVVTSPDQTDISPALANDIYIFGNGGAPAMAASSSKEVRTDTSGRVRYRLGASDADRTLQINTFGWIDDRGRFS